uniref:Glycosyl hydrolase family 38 C-terminal domain-containing protein n=1 Tax=Glossina palpalis gambiensis TaxID=67801 RepID=A0A1B0B0N3_9MUSC
MLVRKCDAREGFEPNIAQKIAGSYYSITGPLAMQEKRHRLALLNGRPQGGASMHGGVCELMIHRRLVGDNDKNG